MTLHTQPFRPYVYLKTPEDVAHYLEAALEGGDNEHLRSATKDAIFSLSLMDSDAPG